MTDKRTLLVLISKIFLYGDRCVNPLALPRPPRRLRHGRLTTATTRSGALTMTSSPPLAQTWVPRPTAASTTSTTSPTPSSRMPPGRHRVGVRIGDHVLDLAAAASATASGVRRTSWTRPTLNPLMAAGPQTWARGARLGGRPAHRPDQQGRVPLVPLADIDALPALRGRGLRRLLRLRAPRDERRQDLPTRRRGAAAELEAPSGRLPRPGRVDRGLRHRHPPPSGQRKAPADAGTVVRPEPSARHRGRAGLRRRPVPSARAAGQHRGVRRHGLRGRPASTTGRRATSRPGSTSRSAPTWRSRSRPASPPGSHRSPRWSTPESSCPARTSRCCPTCARPGRRATTSRSRWRSTAPWSHVRRTRRCTGRRRRCWRTSPSTAPPCGSGTSTHQARSQARRRSSAGPSSSSPGAAREPWTAGGQERTFLEDGDEVVLRYTAPGRTHARMGLGEVRGTILPTT